jgi:hypothetical protein
MAPMENVRAEFEAEIWRALATQTAHTGELVDRLLAAGDAYAMAWQDQRRRLLLVDQLITTLADLLGARPDVTSPAPGRAPGRPA